MTLEDLIERYADLKPDRLPTVTVAGKEIPKVSVELMNKIFGIEEKK